MNKRSRLAVAVAVALVTAVPSSFAESRPSNVTMRGQDRETRRAERPADRPRVKREQVRPAQSSRDGAARANRQTERRSPADRPSTNMRRGDARTQSSGRPAETRRSSGDRTRRPQADRSRPAQANRSRASAPQRRGSDRRSIDVRRDHRGPVSAQRHDSGRQPYFAKGRVSRVLRHGNGYRIWVAGAPYPFFVPQAHYHRNRFRVGLLINLGGFYNPRGYYDYYDQRSSGAMRGVVESVDHRRGTFVVRNDASGSFVTVSMRRGRPDVRPGDYVELYGEWARNGVFQAHELEYIDNRLYR